MLIKIKYIYVNKMQNDKIWEGTNLNPCPITSKLAGYQNYKEATDACYRSCYRNLEVTPTDMMNTGCGMNCQRCGIDLLRLNGKDPFQVELVKPPNWLEPNFFRYGMAQYKDVNKAYLYCNQECGKKGIRNPQECRSNCYIDAMSTYLNK